VWPVVVVVPDAGALLEALTLWSPAGRFPVIIDDGSLAASENIARFVRAFGAKVEVVRWTATPVPVPPDQVRAGIAAAVAAAWATDAGPGAEGKPGDRPAESTAPTGPLLTPAAAWLQTGWAPVGVVAFDPADEAWAAAAILAVARGQIALAVSKPAINGESMSAVDAAGLQAQIIIGLDEARATWRGTGQGIDAVTLAMSLPSRVIIDADHMPQGGVRGGAFAGKAGEALALSDLIGREPAASAPVFTTTRWAWTGQIGGNAAYASYAAACAVFLTARSGQGFDGYDSGRPWSDYGHGLALAALAPLKVLAADAKPEGTLAKWGTRFSAGASADVLFVNTSGQSAYFDLLPGRGETDDVPLLNAPLACYFVHSWSCQNPAGRWTIAGRFIEHGAFMYVGSVHEPFLQGFVQPKIVAQQLAMGMPWGAAVRGEGAGPWRIACMGDPLAGPKFAREPEAATAEGAEQQPTAAQRVRGLGPVTVALSGELATALKAKNVDAAIRLLILQGKDGDAVKLAAAAVDDAAFRAGLSQRTLGMGVLAAFRAKNHEAMTSLAQAWLSDAKGAARKINLDGGDGPIISAIWHSAAARGELIGARHLDLLKATRRTSSPAIMVRDIGTIAAAMNARAKGSGGAYIDSVAATQNDEGIKNQLRELRKGY